MRDPDTGNFYNTDTLPLRHSSHHRPSHSHNCCWRRHSCRLLATSGPRTAHHSELVKGPSTDTSYSNRTGVLYCCDHNSHRRPSHSRIHCWRRHNVHRPSMDGLHNFFYTWDRERVSHPVTAYISHIRQLFIRTKYISHIGCTEVHKSALKSTRIMQIL